MTSSTGISVLILIVTSSVIPSLAGEHRQGDPKETENDIAVRLLKTGKVLYASKGYRLIGKRGGYDQAKRDFDNLNPTNVVDFGTSKWGDVGHTTVVVGTDGSKASLMVLKNKSVPDGDVESIVAKISYIDDNFKY